MDNKATTKRMIGAVVLVLVAALLLAALLRSKKQDAPDMAMDTAGETKPILGFPGVGGDDQKPSLVGEGQNVAQQTDGDTAEQAADATATGSTSQSAGGLIPDVNLPNMAANTTGFEVRPPNDDTRQIVDTDGKVKDGSGNMGGNVTVPSDKAQGSTAAGDQAAKDTGGAAQDSGSTQAAAGSASNNDKPVEPEKKPATSKPVLVGERRVPAAPSAESVAAKKAAAEKAAAAAKAEADKKAAEQAAAAKSRELAAAGTASSAAVAAAGSFSVQVMASSDKAKADAVAAPLKADGHQVSVSKAVVSGKTVYRVQVSGFDSRADASNAQASMKRRYTQNQYVQNSFVTAN